MIPQVLIGPKHLKVHEWMITSSTNKAETLKGVLVDDNLRY